MSTPIPENRDTSIAVRDLTVGWGTKVLLRGLTFDVMRGDIFVVLGGSGCGKSTLLRHIIGLETPLSGSVTFSESAVKKTKSGRPAFGVMFQSGALLGSFSVGENVALQLQQWTSLPPGAIDTIVRAKLRLVGLEGAIDKMPSELSGGTSTLKSLEDAVMRALDDLPAVVDKALSVLSRTDALIASVQGAALPEKASLLLNNASQTVDVLHGKVAGVDSVGISQKANQALGELNQVLARADNLIKRVDSDSGLLSSVQRATDAVGEVAVNARGTAPRLDQTLEHVSDVAVSMQRLLDALERDPDMLLKGHARSEP